MVHPANKSIPSGTHVHLQPTVGERVMRHPIGFSLLRKDAAPPRCFVLFCSFLFSGVHFAASRRDAAVMFGR